MPCPLWANLTNIILAANSSSPSVKVKSTEKEQWKRGRIKDIKGMIKMYQEQIKKLKQELKWLQEE